jgi:hypothetical protein
VKECRNVDTRKGWLLRMPETNPRAELDQTRPLGRVSSIWTEPQHSCRPPQQRCVAERFRSRSHEEVLSVLRQHRQPADEPLLDAADQRVRTLESIRKLRSSPGTWQLEQRKRVAARLGDDPIPDARIDRPFDHRVEQLPCIRFAEAVNPELRQAIEVTLVARLPYCSHNSDPLCH